MKSMIISAVMFLLMSCGGHNEGVILKSEQGFIVFKGDITGVTVSVDNGKSFALDEKTERYQIKPGKHEVKIYRNGDLVLTKVIIIDNQITMEIDIP